MTTMAVKVEAPFPAGGLAVMREEVLFSIPPPVEFWVAWASSVALRRERLDLCVLCCAPIRQGKSLCVDCRAARARASKRQSAAAHLRARRAADALARAQRRGPA